jgi:hypothetical protein
VGSDSSAWVEAIRAGRSFVTDGPLLALARDGDRFRASVRVRGRVGRVEVVANGRVVASGEDEAEVALTEPGWVAARCSTTDGFAHTAPVVVGAPARRPEAVAALRKLVELTREWVEVQGRFDNPKRKQALVDRCAEAVRTLEG